MLQFILKKPHQLIFTLQKPILRSTARFLPEKFDFCVSAFQNTDLEEVLTICDRFRLQNSAFKILEQMGRYQEMYSRALKAQNHTILMKSVELIAKNEALDPRELKSRWVEAFSIFQTLDDQAIFF